MVVKLLFVVPAILFALAASLAADETKQPAGDESLITKWPIESDADDEFTGNRFIPFAKPPQLGDGPFSIAAWVNPEDLAGGAPAYGRGIARSTRNGKIGDWVISVMPGGHVRFDNWRNDGTDTNGGHITLKPCVDTGMWSLVVATWDGKTSHIYVNGREFKFRNVSTDSGWGTGHDIGRGWTGAEYYWLGRIGEFTAFRRTLNPSEIAATFTSNLRSRNPQLTFEVKPAGDAELSKAIDREILTRLNEVGIVAAAPTDDAEFLRRVTLDLAGRIPTVAETEAFLAEDAPDKRRQRIDALLSGREMPDYWAQVLSSWLMPEGGRRNVAFVDYLRRGLRKNRPWDQLAREMLLARPIGQNDRAAGRFLTLRQSAIKDRTIGRDIGRALLGVNLRCAQCHDHPDVPEWTRERFFGLSAFFSRSFIHQYKRGNQQLKALGETATGELQYTAVGGKLTIARPMFLDGRLLDEPVIAPPYTPLKPDKASPPTAPPFSRRQAFADMAINAGSPWFKRAFVNRMWRELMGRGLVEPVDMMHEGNPATHPKLLDLLADDFAGNGFNVRRLIGSILHSEAYARSSRWTGENTPAETLYAVSVLKPMNADQLALSLPLAAGHFDDRISSRLRHGMSRVRPLPPSRELLAAFDASPGRFEPTSEQALMLLNGDLLQKQFGSDSRLVRQLAVIENDDELVRRIWLSILSRRPTDAEKNRATGYFASRNKAARAAICQELAWALLTSTEFRFNH